MGGALGDAAESARAAPPPARCVRAHGRAPARPRPGQHDNGRAQARCARASSMAAGDPRSDSHWCSRQVQGVASCFCKCQLIERAHLLCPLSALGLPAQISIAQACPKEPPPASSRHAAVGWCPEAPAGALHGRGVAAGRRQRLQQQRQQRRCMRRGAAERNRVAVAARGAGVAVPAAACQALSPHGAAGGAAARRGAVRGVICARCLSARLPHGRQRPPGSCSPLLPPVHPLISTNSTPSSTNSPTTNQPPGPPEAGPCGGACERQGRLRAPHAVPL